MLAFTHSFCLFQNNPRTWDTTKNLKNLLHKFHVAWSTLYTGDFCSNLWMWFPLQCLSKYLSHQAVKGIPSSMTTRHSIISPRCTCPMTNNTITNLTILHVISEKIRTWYELHKDNVTHWINHCAEGEH